jgi:2-polyprenyl-6-methoxyphenol hydroxylase-like FAD-dependent oxidoreductase
MTGSSDSALRVLVIGGGLGGLCLAQGLRRRGVRAVVFERDPDPTPPAERYSIDINAFGNRALRECLPPPLWDAYVAIAGQSLRGVRFVTERLDPLIGVDWPAAERAEDNDWRVSRHKLRQVLLTGLDAQVHFGRKLAGYEPARDGRVRAVFEDGSEAVGDVLIGADGVGSRVRKQLLPAAEVRDLRIAAIGAKFPLAQHGERPWLPGPLLERMTIVLPSASCGMFITQYRRTERGTRPTGVPDDLLAPDIEDHAFWSLIARRAGFGAPGDLRDLPSGEMRDLVAGMVRGWSPVLRRLVADSPLHTFAAISIQSSSAIPQWESTNVTLLGDAIHTMTPLQGLGGNTALRDAARLCRNLAQAAEGRLDVRAALGDYEAQMRRYAGDAVRVSRRYAEQFVSDNRMGRAGFKAFLRVADNIPPLKRRLFAPARAKAGWPSAPQSRSALGSSRR